MAKHINMVGAPFWWEALGPGPLATPKAGATYCRDGQFWLGGYFEKAAFGGWIDRFTWQYCVHCARLFKTTNAGVSKKHRGYPDRCPNGGRTFQFDRKINKQNKNTDGTQKKYCSFSCSNALYPAQVIQWANVTSHGFQQISDLKIFPEYFPGPMKTLWRATCGPRACSWTTLP